MKFGMNKKGNIDIDEVIIKVIYYLSQ